MTRTLGYSTLASDFDGTIATEGCVSTSTVEALARLRAAGKRLIMVTGREVPSLLATFDRVDLFDVVVAENGALLYWPALARSDLLAPAVDPAFVAALHARNVAPISVGEVIVATWHPHELVVLQTIAEMGLALNVITNKGAVMVLPAGVDKQTGLHAALALLGISQHELIGVGDAENDHAFLRHCGLAVAVGNALPSVRAQADLVTLGERGAGVEELIAAWLRGELQPSDQSLSRLTRISAKPS
jgi:hydroxymethylpyrimidine pyrophosphatase-like HAD family hydrolase